MSESFHSYSGSEVADTLQISGGTLRRWCIELEKQEYEIVKGKNGERFFREHDIVVLRRIKDLVHHKRLTVSDSIETVISILDAEAHTAPVRDKQQADKQELDVSNQRSQFEQMLLEKLDKQDERFNKQEEFNKALIEKLEQQQRYIDNSINKRDEQLMIAMKQSMETQKQLAIASEQEKPWWKRLFKL